MEFIQDHHIEIKNKILLSLQHILVNWIEEIPLPPRPKCMWNRDMNFKSPCHRCQKKMHNSIFFLNQTNRNKKSKRIICLGMKQSSNNSNFSWKYLQKTSRLHSYFHVTFITRPEVKFHIFRWLKYSKKN